MKTLILIVALVGIPQMAAHLHAAELPQITHPAIHFLSDRTTVMPSDLQNLEDNVAWLTKYDKVVVILEGHCDQTGGADHNMELGDRRAREIKSYLIERGIDPNRIIMVVSFGETRPVDPRESHAALQKNRRVEFVLR